jgi:hypothetical protein
MFGVHFFDLFSNVAAQVAGGDEPPSVLSDNLSKVWPIEPDLFCVCVADDLQHPTLRGMFPLYMACIAMHSVSRVGTASRT